MLLRCHLRYHLKKSNLVAGPRVVLLEKQAQKRELLKEGNNLKIGAILQIFVCIFLFEYREMLLADNILCLKKKYC